MNGDCTLYSVHTMFVCVRSDMLNNLVDESDPDLDLPNIVHAFQTAERIRYTESMVLVTNLLLSPSF